VTRSRALIGLAVALLGAATICGCGSSRSAGSSSSPRLVVSPSPAQTSSEVRFSFTAPVAAGGTTSYSLSVTGPAGNGCVGAKEAGSPKVAKGATATITLGPSQLGKPWCAGYYTARVFELVRAACKPGTECAQDIRVQGTVATGSFTVKKA
jgi:hypothetical protein